MKGVFFMGRKSKFSYEEKIVAVEDYLSGKRTAAQIINELQIVQSVFSRWVLNYQTDSPNSLLECPKNRFYPIELKMNAVEEYLNGNSSLANICGKYKIKSDSILRSWIKQYNGHKKIKSHNSIGDKIMTKGRKTTYEERVEIVSFCIENNDNYQKSAEKFKVSYQQVYTWTKKYRESGLEALQDNRGKRKDLSSMTESEKLIAQMKLLEAENKRLQMEVGFLKKLEEVERRQAGKANILPFKNTTKKPGSQ